MSEPQPVPLNALFGNDFVTQLALVMSNDTMTDVAEKVAHHSVGKRLEPRDVPKVVIFDGRVIPADTTVEQASIPPLACIVVEWADRIGDRVTDNSTPTPATSNTGAS
ncbi:MAG: toluene monooxygenase system protein [Ilumatobacteraceae bacterium]|jgi:toluene monooxygenase system protein B